MAQRTENEETEFKPVPEPMTPCINGVTAIHHKSPRTEKEELNGVTASSSMMQHKSPRTEKEEVLEPITQCVNGVISPSTMIHHKSPRSTSPRSSPSMKETVVMKREVNRCSGCRKKIGLTGFRCRCGEMFCSHHRYSDRHDCSYDYKLAGREVIERENPVVKAAKIVKI